MATIWILALWLSINTFSAEACGPGPAVGAGVGNIAGIAGAIPGGKCIYDEASVRMADGSTKKVKNLEIGDHVLAYSPNRGVHASRIFADLHNDKDTSMSIYEIETSSGRKIPVTAEHSLFVRPCLSDDKENWTPKSAQDVRVGECVPRYYREDGGDVIEDSVVRVRVFEAKGIRQPVTETGTIVVDDVVVSCYDRVVDQDASHMALFPYRWILQLTQTYATQAKSLIPSILNAIGFTEMSLV